MRRLCIVCLALVALNGQTRPRVHASGQIGQIGAALPTAITRFNAGRDPAPHASGATCRVRATGDGLLSVRARGEVRTTAVAGYVIRLLESGTPAGTQPAARDPGTGSAGATASAAGSPP